MKGGTFGQIQPPIGGGGGGGGGKWGTSPGLLKKCHEFQAVMIAQDLKLESGPYVDPPVYSWKVKGKPQVPDFSAKNPWARWTDRIKIIGGGHILKACLCLDDEQLANLKKNLERRLGSEGFRIRENTREGGTALEEEHDPSRSPLMYLGWKIRKSCRTKHIAPGWRKQDGCPVEGWKPWDPDSGIPPWLHVPDWQQDLAPRCMCQEKLRIFLSSGDIVKTGRYMIAPITDKTEKYTASDGKEITLAKGKFEKVMEAIVQKEWSIRLNCRKGPTKLRVRPYWYGGGDPGPPDEHPGESDDGGEGQGGG